MRRFLVFRCSKCQNFTNAPVGQKRRRCSYCGKIINITKAVAALFDSPEEAAIAVKAFNASRGGDEFEKAVEISRERIRKLLPPEEIRRDSLTQGEDESPQAEGKRKRLMSLLKSRASERSCPLDQFEGHCEAAGLEWAWVEEQLQNLANSGSLIFPRPWSIRMVGFEKKDKKESDDEKDVGTSIIRILDERGGRLRVSDIIEHFEEAGVTRTSIERSLERLMQRGDIYEPKQGEVSLL